ncbi:M57 family metalloprotease [Spirosoma sp. 209]|uniref:M57 family metalloprotease n=1 Tax=Spirosoma sp. 209 TaxID=1955701 RepID=UPI00098D469B|nr:M57 family metalloprotease [Spirosoma sp. 209]
MRIILGFVWLLVVLVFSYACQVQELPLPTSADNAAAVRAYLNKLGYADSLIVDAGEYFVVEGDMRFPKDRKVPNLTGALEEQAWEDRDALIERYNRIRNIRVWAQPEIAPIAGHVMQAMQMWNNAGSSIRFVNAPNRFDRDITIYNGTIDGPDAVGESNLPLLGKPGRDIVLDVAKIRVMPDNIKKVLIAHEFGHTIGFRHTDWRRFGEPNSVDIPAVPEADAASIMNAVYIVSSNSNLTGLSAKDKLAVKALYPSAPYSLYFDPTSIPVILRWKGPYHRIAGFQIVHSTIQRGIEVDNPVFTIQTSDGRAGSYTFRYRRCACTTGGGLLNVKVRILYTDNGVSPWSAMASVRIQ